MKTIRLGRDPQKNDVCINNPVVSSQHALLMVKDDGTVMLRDLNSKNKTYVNGKMVTTDTLLKVGDSVMLGNYSLDWQAALNHPVQTKRADNKDISNTPLLEKQTIGRAMDCQIRISHDDVSSYHAFIGRSSDGTIMVIDNNSTNGTYVNGKRIFTTVLHSGDKLLVSKHEIEWEKMYISTPTPKPQHWITKIVASIFTVAAIVTALFFVIPDNILDHIRPDLSPESIYAKYKKTVVLIYQQSSYDATVDGRPLSAYIKTTQYDHLYIDTKGNIVSGMTGSSGTGFFISSTGLIMTNKHVVAPIGEELKDAEKIKSALSSLLISNGLNALASNLDISYKVHLLSVAINDTYVNSTADMLPCSVVKTSDDPELDVAIIQTNSKKTPDEVKNTVDLNHIASSQDLQMGKKIYSIGFPQSFIIGETAVGLEANNQSGEVTQDRGKYIYGHNIAIHQGASGSPVFDRRGHFAGIIVSGFLGVSHGFNQAIRPIPAAEFGKKSM